MPNTNTPFAACLSCFGYSKHYTTEAEARAAVEASGFEAVISANGRRIASYSIFGGWSK